MRYLPFEMQSSNQHSRLAQEMGLSLEEKGSSMPQDFSKFGKQKILSRHANQILKSQDKHKLKSPFDQTYYDRHHESSRKMPDELMLQPKSSQNSQKPRIGRKANKNELVKHMSNLPGYLQQVEKVENMQEKALNFGVLDWERLEKWRYKKCMSPKSSTNASSSGSKSLFKAGGLLTSPSTVHTRGRNLASHKKQPPAPRSHINLFREECIAQDVRRSRGKVVAQDFENSRRHTSDRWQNHYHTNKSAGKYYSEMKCKKGKKKDSDQKITPEKETLLPGLRKHEASHPSKDETINQNNVVTNKVEELQTSEFDQIYCPDDKKIGLLLQDSSRKSCPKSVLTSKHRMSIDGNSKEGNGGSSANDIAPQEVHSSEHYSEIPHSCPLPTGTGTNSESNVIRHSFTNSQGMGLSDDTSCMLHCSDETPIISSNGTCINENASSTKPSTANGPDTSKRMDHDTTETAAMKGRPSSPTRRFGFGIGRISRSLSFKGRSAIPQLDPTYATVKSGPVRPEASDCFSPEEVHSAEFFSDTLLSCRPPVGAEPPNKSDLVQNSLTGARRMDLSFDASCMFLSPNEKPNSPSVNATMTSKLSNLEATELVPVKGRHPSPNRRFSFNLSRMSRSFSSKEGSMATKMTSAYTTVKSGLLRSESSESLDDANRNKANISGRARSSPLRRIIDPLLKARATNPQHCADTTNSFIGSLNLTSEVISNTESLPHNNDDASVVQAFLQLTVKNGLPLFKLVNDNSDILVAMKKLSAPCKDDSSWIYTFYCIHEIKKKSGSWISQGQKEKSYGFRSNEVAQMKVFCPYYPDLTSQSSEGQFTARESILYSVDLTQADQETPQLVPKRELAAIIVKTPIESSSDGGDPKKGKEGFLECSEEYWNSYAKAESEKRNSTTVILPGAVHSFPDKGVPSPLIERWKSGGSCDCGGWDVGCKLRILTNEDQICELPGPSISSATPDHVELFDQGRAFDNGPIFSLEPLEKGIYSVKFSASISLLQAFSICVAVTSTQKSFDFSEVNSPSQDKVIQESALTPTKVQREMPGRYVRSPPSSPFGRV